MIIIIYDYTLLYIIRYSVILLDIIMYYYVLLFIIIYDCVIICFYHMLYILKHVFINPQGLLTWFPVICNYAQLVALGWGREGGNSIT